MFDSPGDDVLFSKPEQTRLYNLNDPANAFYVRANLFEYVYAYSVRGGKDVARMFDSPGDDVLFSKPEQTRLYNLNDPANTFYVQAKLFEYVNAYAVSGGKDVARMFDSPGRDLFIGRSDWSRMLGLDADYNNRARSFEEVYAYAIYGGEDRAKLADSGQTDRLEAALPKSDPNHWARVFSDAISPLDYFYYVRGFEHAAAWSSNSEDTANVDPDATDAVIGWLELYDWL